MRTSAAKPLEQPPLILPVEGADVSQDERACLAARKFERSLRPVRQNRFADVRLQQKQDLVCDGDRPFDKHIGRALAQDPRFRVSSNIPSRSPDAVIAAGERRTLTQPMGHTVSFCTRRRCPE